MMPQLPKRIANALQAVDLARGGLALSAALAGSALAMTLAVRRIPSLFGDEWVVTATVLSKPMLEAVLSGHNGVPSYLQNLLWHLDLTLLDYRGLLPEFAENVALIAGLTLLLTSLRIAGMSGSGVAWLAALFLSLWFSSANHEQYANYVWRGVEAAGVLACLGAALLFAVLSVRARGDGQQRRELTMALAALACAWLALYFHGGFAVLPLVAVFLATSSPRWQTRLASIVVAALFAWHFTEVHFTATAAGVDDAATLRQRLVGAMVLPASLPYTLLTDIVGGELAMATAALITLTGVGLVVVVARRCWRHAATPLDAAIFVLLSYPLLIAFATVWVRVDATSTWTMVLAPRYTNYSVYFLVALAAGGLQAGAGRGRWLLMPAAALGLLAWLDGVIDFRATWRHQERQQAYMVPYTLEPWTLAPRPTITARQRDHAQSYRAILRTAGANVFSARSYRIFTRARTQPIALGGLPDCRIQWKVLQFDDIHGRKLYELRGKLGRGAPFSPDSVLFVDEAGAPLGWAPFFPHLLSRSVFRGYTWIPAGAFVTPVVVDEKGKPLCASPPILDVSADPARPSRSVELPPAPA